MTPTSFALRSLAVICFTLAAPTSLEAQTRASISGDISVGGAQGGGSDFVDRTLHSARIAASARAVRPSGIGAFIELAQDWVGISTGHKGCLLRPDGSCTPIYPEFVGQTATIGVIATSASREARAGAGAGRYDGGRAAVGAFVAQGDVAGFVTSHVGLMLSARYVMVPSYFGERLDIVPITVGIRLR